MFLQRLRSRHGHSCACWARRLAVCVLVAFPTLVVAAGDGATPKPAPKGDQAVRGKTATLSVFELSGLAGTVPAAPQPERTST